MKSGEDLANGRQLGPNSRGRGRPLDWNGGATLSRAPPRRRRSASAPPAGVGGVDWGRRGWGPRNLTFYEQSQSNVRPLGRDEGLLPSSIGGEKRLVFFSFYGKVTYLLVRHERPGETRRRRRWRRRRWRRRRFVAASVSPFFPLPPCSSSIFIFFLFSFLSPTPSIFCSVFFPFLV